MTEEILTRLLSGEAVSGQTLSEELGVTRAAAMFAAKEAVAKALGTGFAQGVMPWQIEVTHEQSGKPGVLLTGAAREKFEQIGGRSILLSLSHEGDTAIAFALIQ